MSSHELRLECLRLATAKVEPDLVVEYAEKFYAFASGEKSKTPRQIIDQALDEANVI